MAFNDFIKHIKYFTGNKYLVIDTDDEPLIKNVKILRNYSYGNRKYK